MSKKCFLTGKSSQYGNRVSHAKNRTRHVFKPNIQSKRIYVPSLDRFVTLPLSTYAIRTIDKLGVEGAFKKYNIDLKSL